MRVAFYHDDDNGLNHGELLTRASSGTVMSLLNLVKALSNEGHEVLVLSKAESKIIDRVTYIKLDGEDEVLEWYKNNKIDAFVAVGRTGKILKTISKEKKSKLIYWHHNYLDVKGIAELTKKNLVDHIVAVSPHHMSSLYKYLIFSDISYIRNPVDFSLFDSFDIRKEERTGFAYVGNISKAKGFDSVIALYEAYKRIGGQEKLHVYGSNSLYCSTNTLIERHDFTEDFISKVEKLTFDNDLILHGKVNRYDLYKALSERKILLCGLNKTGGAESAGMGMVEAQYLGCKVLTYNRGGQPDSVFARESISRVNEKILLKNLVELEEKNKLDLTETRLWLEERYGMNQISNQWIGLINGDKYLGRHYHAVTARIKSLFK